MVASSQQATPQQQAVAMWLAIERHGGRPTKAVIATILRYSFGLHFRNGELSTWLKPFRHRAVPGQNGAAHIIEGGRAGADLGRPSRARQIELPVSNLSDPSDLTHDAPHRGKAPRALKLPFDRELLDRRDTILRAVWQRVGAIIGPSTTFTDWRKRNSQIGLSLARNFTVEQVLFAWEEASSQGIVRELRLVQAYIERVECHAVRA